MHRVVPSVRLIAHTAIDEEKLIAWLREVGGDRAGDNRFFLGGDDGEVLVELAGRRCYKAFTPGLNPNVTRLRTESQEYHANLLAQGHGSVFEHTTATWAIENVSRVFTHELVRNRAGNAFSQESLRYVRLEDLGFWFPPEIELDQVAVDECHRVIRVLEEHQAWLAKHFKIDQERDFNRKKRLTSAFRRLAPIGLATGIVLTTNLRSLRWLIEQRTDQAAEIEIRLVFNLVAEIAKETWPMVFQDFEAKNTGDGDIRAWVPRHHKV